MQVHYFHNHNAYKHILAEIYSNLNIKHIFELKNKKIPASCNRTSFQEFYKFCET